MTSSEVVVGKLVRLIPERYSEYKKREISSYVGMIMSHAINKKRVTILWTTGKKEERWCWELKTIEGDRG